MYCHCVINGPNCFQIVLLLPYSYGLSAEVGDENVQIKNVKLIFMNHLGEFNAIYYIVQ